MHTILVLQMSSLSIKNLIYYKVKWTFKHENNPMRIITLNKNY